MRSFTTVILLALVGQASSWGWKATTATTSPMPKWKQILGSVRKPVDNSIIQPVAKAIPKVVKPVDESIIQPVVKAIPKVVKPVDESIIQPVVKAIPEDVKEYIKKHPAETAGGAVVGLTYLALVAQALGGRATTTTTSPMPKWKQMLGPVMKPVDESIIQPVAKAIPKDLLGPVLKPVDESIIQPVAKAIPKDVKKYVEEHPAETAGGTVVGLAALKYLGAVWRNRDNLDAPWPTWPKWSDYSATAPDAASILGATFFVFVVGCAGTFVTFNIWRKVLGAVEEPLLSA